jgi:hypothetical protein
VTISSDGAGINNTNAARETWLTWARYGLTGQEVQQIFDTNRRYLREVAQFKPQAKFMQSRINEALVKEYSELRNKYRRISAISSPFPSAKPQDVRFGNLQAISLFFQTN